MLDVLSMGQFLTMTGDVREVVADAGGTTNYDWMNYLITRFEPSDGPQNQMVAFMRSIFGSHVLIHPMLKSTAISDVGNHQSNFIRGRTQPVYALEPTTGRFEAMN